jgi:hypothetical protein
VGRRQVRRLRRLEGLRVPPTKRKIPSSVPRRRSNPGTRTPCWTGVTCT